ncbi:MAG: glycosyltransferase family 2 protein, partial [Opitutales bacterium]
MPAWISAETILALVALACALMPALMMLANGWYFRRAEEPDNGEMPEVTVCVPARNEVERIGLTLEALRRQTQVRLTVLVGDDHSTDGTAELVEKVSAEDSRVQLVSVPGLPAGWSGKQHALNHLAGLAITPWVAFLDADVSLAPGALSRLVTCARQRKLDLVSGFPRQVTRSWGEALLIPHIQFILLGFLPFFMARAWNHPAFAAGCGQLFLARRESYLRAGGHALIKASFHDGLHLPRAFRREGLRTGAIDGSDLADCRMYAGFSETWAGL